MMNRCRPGRPPNSYERRNQLLLVLLVTVTTLVVANRALAEASRSEPNPVDFNIPAQSVPAALSEFARQARVQLFFISDGFEDIQANAVIGTYATQQALDLLLAGTGLAASISSESGVKVRPVSASINSLFLGSQSFARGPVADSDNEQYAGQQSDAQSRRMGQDDASDIQQVPKQLEEIIVTGTNIRGVIPESTPLKVYDAVDIRNTGALTVEQFVSRLPQNNNTLSEIGSGSSSQEVNSTADNSVDLRGLGVGSTLVLLNGRRMAPSSSGRSADISFIPIGAVERVEILTDGASAVYGADAIGGVINFVLKEQQDGAETILTLGGTDGGNEQVRFDQSFGFNWADGNAFVALSYMDRSALDAADRDFAQAAAPFTLVPKDTRKNILATVAQLVPGSVTISTDLLYSTREPRTVSSLNQFPGNNFTESKTDHEQTVLNFAIERLFGERLNTALLFTYADATSDSKGMRDGSTVGAGPFFTLQETSSLDVTAKVDGELIRFRSGALMFAVGVGYIEDDYDDFRDFSVPTGVAPSAASLDRDSKYAFAETQIPIVSPSQNVGGIRRLELNLAARYTDYSDFGDDISPKIGILWSPVALLKIRGTLGESFKAPFLFQTDPSGGLNGFFPISALGTPDIWSPDNSSIMLFASGAGNPALEPERAETYTAGFDIDLSGLTISATYFNINYTDRIAEPDSQGGSIALVNPQAFPDFFDSNPTLEEITAILAVSENFLNLTGIDTNDPTAVHAATTVLFDNRIRNLSISEMEGLDLGLDYTLATSAGQFGLGVNATKIFEFEEQTSPNAAPVTKVDTVLFPADLKARGYLSFQKDHWNARLNVNYVDDYDNPFDAANPTVADWTTVDLLFSFTFPTGRNGVLDGIGLSLTVQNAFDKDPPFVPVGSTSDISIFNPIGFDPANANPLGRFIDLQISKRW
jgi:outer membrane receptor protein involved in Fe transport